MHPLSRQDDRLLPPAPALARLFGGDAQRSSLYADPRLVRLLGRLPIENITVSVPIAPGHGDPPERGLDLLAAVRAGHAALILRGVGYADLFYEAAIEEIVTELAGLERRAVRLLDAELVVASSRAAVTIGPCEHALAARVMRGAAQITVRPTGGAAGAARGFDLVAGAGLAAMPEVSLEIDPRADLAVIAVVRYAAARGRLRPAGFGAIVSAARAAPRILLARLGRRGAAERKAGSAVVIEWPARPGQREMSGPAQSRQVAGTSPSSAP